ncbi:MAG: putative Ig domain-containing protein [Crocinitomicaceae bacterium]|nr:putative Ig domain-containing protein [Crocinitomicaceae bacterium]
MKKLVLFLSLFICAFTAPIFGQAVISESVEPTPAVSSILDLQSSSKGLLPPRLTTQQRDAILSPAEGLTIFNLSTHCTNVYNGTNWYELCGTCTPPAPTGLTYDYNGPLDYCVGEAITVNNPSTNSGTPSTYSVSPSLPDGVSLNTSTGQLSGTPTAATGIADYAITGFNACGSTMRTLSIAVFAALDTPGSISGSDEVLAGAAGQVYSISPVTNATSYSWTLPSGWNITDGAGTNSITVTVGNTSGNVSVVASNPCGSVSQSLAVNTWGSVVATGGNISDIDVDGVTYRVHSFTSVGTHSFNVTATGTETTVQYLVIGGGGGGGGATHSQNGSGGGGAGGYRCSVPGETSGGGAAAESPLSVAIGSYTVVVGDGGAGQPNSSIGRGANGSNSVFGSITALGGGGGCGSGLIANTGGSGGGGDTYTGNGAGASAPFGAAGTAGQGYGGGNALSGSGGGGGGGAASAGSSGAGGVGGNGGSGRASSITGVSITRAGGGGACSWENATPGSGGSGGGGSAGNQNSSPEAGAANTGSGGGASKSPYAAGNGGSGIVIVRYPITNPN